MKGEIGARRRERNQHGGGDWFFGTPMRSAEEKDHKKKRVLQSRGGATNPLLLKGRILPKKIEGSCGETGGGKSTIGCKRRKGLHRRNNGVKGHLASEKVKTDTNDGRDTSVEADAVKKGKRRGEQEEGDSRQSTRLCVIIGG